MIAHDDDAPKDLEFLPKNVAATWVQRGYMLAGAGAVLSIIAGFVERARFPFAYLTSFVWFLTIALGALFFVLLQHVTKSGWSVAPRRHMEWISSNLTIGALLFVPIALFLPTIYSAWLSEEALREVIIAHKSAYLNAPFFFVRAAFYFATWILLSWWFAKTSRAFDTKGDVKKTERMSTISAPSLLIFAVTITFAAFDWLMSLQPKWYSTIFGVYIFSGAVTSSLSAVALLNLYFRKNGYLRRVFNEEHQHDIGKLLFAFTIFWAYIAFSQYMLIWYSNLPEETIFFAHRWIGAWKIPSLALVFGHFLFPFLLLLSREAKRSIPVLAFGAFWMLAMHWVDMYWLVMPIAEPAGARIGLSEPATILLFLGVLIASVASKASREPLYPLHDPRLADAYKVNNP